MSVGAKLVGLIIFASILLVIGYVLAKIFLWVLSILLSGFGLGLIIGIIIGFFLGRASED